MTGHENKSGMIYGLMGAFETELFLKIKRSPPLGSRDDVFPIEYLPIKEYPKLDV